LKKLDNVECFPYINKHVVQISELSYVTWSFLLSFISHSRKHQDGNILNTFLLLFFKLSIPCILAVNQFFHSIYMHIIC